LSGFEKGRDMIGISTCWWNPETIPGDRLVSEIIDLGFEGVELEYRITNAFYQQMRPQLTGRLRVLSIHNFFPKPEERAKEQGSGDLFLLSATDRDEREAAVKYTLRTIEHANALEAKAVVLHLGHVDIRNPVERFRELYENEMINQEEGVTFLEEQREVRKSKQRKNLDAVLFSLEKLNQQAERQGVFIGIENRYHFHEIPSYEEIGIILSEFEGGNVRYWHDVGHAGVQENLGICRHKDLLDAYSDRMIGIHLHDVYGLDDHLSPGQGDLDYEKIIPFLKPDLIKIMEVHPKVSKEELLEGFQFVQEGMAKTS
jgi:sugar phosphate isomerase/epimerase